MDELQELRKAIQSFGLTGLPQLVLEEIAVDPHGLELAAAPSVIASLTNQSLAQCNLAITDLASSQFLIKIKDGPRERLVANYTKLGLTEEIRLALLCRSSSFDTLGAPHSPKAMATLDRLFDEKEAIYIGLEITSHRVFKKLSSRAQNQLSTIFLMPRKQDIPTERHSHYQEVINEWIEFIKSGDIKLKSFVQIRQTSLPYKHLYTSSISSSSVRFDMYEFTGGEHTTRRGDMVEAKRDSSLYEMIYREYCEAMYHSLPLFKLRPIEYLTCYCRKYNFSILGIIIAICLTWYGDLIAMLLAAVVAGIAANSIYDILRARRWAPPSLYEK